ncbi:MAG TPA: multicopper oxidase family protein [Pseudonocardiaceae bacterium]|nr:multicopper oxidase family protein [Pseudonocardiaceae bacterium]
MLDRRKLLTLAVSTGAGALLIPVGTKVAGAVRAPDMAGMDMSAMSGSVAPAHHGPMVMDDSAVPAQKGFTGTPFTMPMIVPAELRPMRSLFGTDNYRIAMRPAKVELVPGVPSDLLTYDGTFVGPTIRARSGRTVRVTFDNQLPDAATVHLHGSHVTPFNDGQPMNTFAPGESRTYVYDNSWPAQTMWYHDHNHPLVAQHVYHGLHGFYIVEDDFERSLHLPRDEYDVPIMLAESTFDDSGVLTYDFFDFDRPTILVNGRPQPFFRVAARKYRIRLLNGSNHGVLTLDLGGAEMLQIASDQGLLPAPVPLTKLVLSPAERADLIVDFSRYRLGSHVTLNETRGPILRFDVDRHAHDTSRVPRRMRPMEPAPPVAATREVVLSTNFDTIESYINGKVYDMDRIDFRMRLNTSEIWSIKNIDTDFGGVDHAFHLHHVKFRVLDRDGAPPQPWESGWKDTVLCSAGSTVRVQVVINGSETGTYVCHCHMLEHEEAGMMANMEFYA